MEDPNVLSSQPHPNLAIFKVKWPVLHMNLYSLASQIVPQGLFNVFLPLRAVPCTMCG